MGEKITPDRGNKHVFTRKALLHFFFHHHFSLDPGPSSKRPTIRFYPMLALYKCQGHVLFLILEGSFYGYTNQTEVDFFLKQWGKIYPHTQAKMDLSQELHIAEIFLIPFIELHFSC